MDHLRKEFLNEEKSKDNLTICGKSDSQREDIAERTDLEFDSTGSGGLWCHLLPRRRVRLLLHNYL